MLQMLSSARPAASTPAQPPPVLVNELGEVGSERAVVQLHLLKPVVIAPSPPSPTLPPPPLSPSLFLSLSLHPAHVTIAMYRLKDKI